MNAGSGTTSMQPIARELVAHRNAVQQLANHARRGAALGVIERPHAETQAHDVALEDA